MTARYASMTDLLKSISPDVRLPPDAVVEPARTDTLLHLAQNGVLRERDLQAACFERFAELAVHRHEYGMIFAIPNGQYRQGQRMEPGLKSGLPDVFCAVPRQWVDEHGDVHYLAGLFIELKTERGVVRPEQFEWMHRLTCQGYRCVVCRSVEQVIREIEEYLRL